MKRAPRKTPGEKQQRTGLSALAQLSPDGGACLSVDDIACCAEGMGGEEFQKRCHEHLGCCQRCYELWFAARRDHILEKKDDRTALLKKVLFSRRGLYAAGSALAAAAAVFVVFNFQQPAVMLKDASKAEQEHLLNMQQEVTPREEMEAERNLREKKTTKALSPRVKAPSVQYEESDLPLKQEAKERANRADEDYAGAPGQSGSEGSSTGSVSAPAEQRSGVNIEEVIARVSSGCANVRTQQYWQELDSWIGGLSPGDLETGKGIMELFLKLKDEVAHMAENGSQEFSCREIARLIDRSGLGKSR